MKSTSTAHKKCRIFKKITSIAYEKSNSFKKSLSFEDKNVKTLQERQLCYHENYAVLTKTTTCSLAHKICKNF